MDKSLKKALLDKCIQLVNEKIELNKRSVAEAQEAANEEEKSSAGDKYETGRAMMHLEQEKTTVQLEESLKLKMALDKINVNSKSDKIDFGSLVTTDRGIFFLSVGLGQVTLDGQMFFIISPVSPIGKELQGKKMGDAINVNGRTFNILEII